MRPCAMLSFIRTVLHGCLGLTKTQVLKKKAKSQKIIKRCDRTYVVINHLNDVIVRIQHSLRAKPKVVHVSRLKSYHGKLRVVAVAYQKLKELRLHESCRKPHWIERSRENESKSESSYQQDDDHSTVHGNTTSRDGLRRSKRTRNPPKQFELYDLSGTDNV